VSTIIVIGASAGGFHALASLISELPADLPAPVAIVLHIGSHRSQLAEILQRQTPLAVTWAEDGMQIRPGTIYIAPPDQHLFVDPGVLRVARGPRENLARPAIDPLFRSAAQSYGAGVIGVILTGRLNDGTAGLLEIKRLGGVVVVQDPDDAEQPGMPRSALKHVSVDHVVELKGMGLLLGSLVSANVADRSEESTTMKEHSRAFDTPVAFTCPDCGGALRREDSAAMLTYVCHTGHRVSGSVLATAQLENAERHIESTIRLLHEAESLAKDFQSAAIEAGDMAGARAWQQSEQKVRTALEQVLVLGAGLPRPSDLDVP
jgi:two-component system chemotaxis response regulator CheB